MGWFLTKKKSGSSKRRKPAVPVRAKWDPQRTLAAIRVLASIAVLAGLVVGWYFGQKHLRDYVSRKQASVVTPQNVHLASAPAWMSARLHDELSLLVAESISPDPLDQQSLENASTRLRQSAWVASVEQLQRLPDGGVVVRAQYRQPVAVVESAHGYHLVDAQGVQLPGLYVQTQIKALNLPLIVGVAALAPGPGYVWSGADLQAGIALVLQLAGEPYMEQVTAVDVSQRDSRARIRLTLHTRKGGILQWGLPPGQEQSIESSAVTKKSWLQDLYRQRGSIADGGTVVSIYGPAVFIHTLPGDQDAQVRYTWTQ